MSEVGSALDLAAYIDTLRTRLADSENAESDQLTTLLHVMAAQLREAIEVDGGTLPPLLSEDWRAIAVIFFAASRYE